jgi:gluconolactonase
MDLDHPEGLNFGQDGRLFAGGELGQIYAIDLKSGQVEEIARTGGFILGLAVDGDRNVYACDHVKHCVFRMEADGKVLPFCTHVESKPLAFPNYCAFDESGNLFVTDSGDFWRPSGRLVKVSPDGTAVSLLGDHLCYPNGLALSPERDSLFMVESSAANILSIPLKKDDVEAPEIYVQLQGTVPDGLAFDQAGNLYVACYKPDLIYKVDRYRNVQVLIDDKTGQVLRRPTNVAFSPDDSTLLYFSNLGGWYIGALDVGISGSRLCYPTATR